MPDLSSLDARAALVGGPLPRDSLVSFREVVAITGLSKSTLYRRMRAREFPMPKRTGDLLVWPAGAVLDWISSLPDVTEL